MASYFKNHPAPSFRSHYGLHLQHNHGLIFLCMTRDTNNNVIVYELNVKNGIINRKVPVLVYWLDVDAVYRRRRRTKIDYCDLSLREHMLYGCRTTRIGGNKWKFYSGALGQKLEGVITWDGKRNAEFIYKGHVVHTGHAKLNSKYNMLFSPFKYVKCIEFEYGDKPVKTMQLTL
jgi:hypothetical protein